MDKISFENEKDADALMDELSPRVESPSEISELASTVAIPLCLISRRVWIGEWIFCPARQKSAGILTDGKDF